MKVYLEEKDIGRKITTYHDGLGTQQGLYVYGKDKIEVLSLSDYTKQVRKEVLQQVYKVLEQAVPHSLSWSWAVINKELEQIQGVEDGEIN